MIGFRDYRPPKEVRALFIIHYSPLLLIIMIGPLTPICRFWYGLSFWEIPLPMLPTVIAGLLIFIGGALFFMKWEMFWERTYRGQLVTEGFFRYIRHPHYSSLLMIGVGLALFFYSLIALLISLLAFPIMAVSVIDEEKRLIERYGEDYIEYMRKVKWRLIPWIF